MSTTRTPARAPARAPIDLPSPIPLRALVAAGPFARLSAGAVATAIARAFVQAGRPAPDVLELGPPTHGERTQAARRVLDDAAFDARMRDARAVVIAWERLERRALADSVAFEIATRARQGGVPAYAITREDRLGAFGARMLDLQLVLPARGTRSLTAAASRLAQL